MLGTVPLVDLYTRCTVYNNILVIATQNSGTNSSVVNSFEIIMYMNFKQASNDYSIRNS